jgi:hypothetical protein
VHGYTKERERNNNQNDFFFPTEERAPFLTAKERWWRVTLWGGRLLSAAQRVCDGKTHKALLPTFEHERDAESNINVGVDVEKV